MQTTTYNSSNFTSTSFSPFTNADISCTTAILTVTARGDTTVSLEGWEKLAEVKTKHGNIQGSTVDATTATFTKASPGTNESATVTSVYSTTYSATLVRI